MKMFTIDWKKWKADVEDLEAKRARLPEFRQRGKYVEAVRELGGLL